MPLVKILIVIKYAVLLDFDYGFDISLYQVSNCQIYIFPSLIYQLASFESMGL